MWGQHNKFCNKIMRTLKSFQEESFKFFSENPEYFKASYSKKMGGTQTVIIEGVGEFHFDDRSYYQGRGAKYNNPSMHDNLGEIRISKDQFDKAVLSRARNMYQMEKSRLEQARAERKAYKAAAELVGKERLDKGIELVRSIEAKTYYFIENVMIYKAYMSEHITIEVVSDEYRKGFVWEEWAKAPYAFQLGMTEDDKNLFVC